MSNVFAAPRSALDRGLLATNLAVTGLAVTLVTLARAAGAFAGDLQVPIALALVTWLFATPLLTGFGGIRARRAGRGP